MPPLGNVFFVRTNPLPYGGVADTIHLTTFSRLLTRGTCDTDILQHLDDATGL